VKINFILNAMSISGGVKAEFMLAHELKKHGHEINVIYPRFPRRIGAKLFRPIQLMKEVGYWTLDRWKPLEWYGDINVMKVPTLDSRYIPDADICVAHSWEANYCVNKYPKSKGVKFYHIQDPEDWTPKDNAVRQRGYALGQYNIVTSQFVKRIVEKYGKVTAVLPHAPDHTIFYPEAVTRDGTSPIRVLMCYRKDKGKGIARGVKAYQKVIGDKRLIMFGMNDYCDFPIDEYHAYPKDDHLRRIYNSCDIFLFPSEREGWGMPPMEAMACGVPVVSTSVGAVPEFITPGISGIIANDVESMTKAMLALMQNRNKRERIGLAAYEAMKQYTWQKSGKMLEKILFYAQMGVV
jgi:glycosyltransferase involved in cell wall biosynthesis